MSFPTISDEQIRAAIAQMPEDDRVVWEQLLADRETGRQRAAVMIALGDMLDDAEVREMVTKWWDVTEAWSGDPELRDGMYDLLDRAGPIIDDLPEGETFTIYRGNLGEHPGTGSWTLDREVAEGFARMAMSVRGMFLGMHRDDGVPSVWRATVERDRVLAYFAERDEQEIVVSGDDLRDITLIGQAVTVDDD